MTRIDYLNPSDVGQPRGEYTQVAVLRAPAGTDLCFLGGQVGVDDSGRIHTDLGPQLEQTFLNIERALRVGGASLQSVLQLTTYLTSPAHVDQYFAARSELFPRLFPGERYPPNALVVVQALARPTLLVEVQAIAAVVDEATSHPVSDGAGAVAG